MARRNTYYGLMIIIAVWACVGCAYGQGRKSECYKCLDTIKANNGASYCYGQYQYWKCKQDSLRANTFKIIRQLSIEQVKERAHIIAAFTAVSGAYYDAYKHSNNHLNR